MKKIVVFSLLAVLSVSLFAQTNKTIPEFNDRVNAVVIDSKAIKGRHSSQFSGCKDV